MTHFNQSTNDFLFNNKKIDDFNLEQLIEVYNDLLFNVSFKDEKVNAYFHFLIIWENIPITNGITVISLKMAIGKMEKVINETLKYSKELKEKLTKNTA